MIKPILALSLLVLAGCSSSSAPLHYYQLYQGMPEQYPTEVAEKHVLLSSVNLADYLNQTAMVMRTADNSLFYSKQNLWGNPLKDDVMLTLFDELNLAAGQQVYLRAQSPLKTAQMPKLDILIEQLIPGERGEVALQASYWLTNPDQTSSSGRIRINKPINGSGYAPAVTAMREALQQLAQQLNRTIRPE